ncbi:MAG: phage virion morphogenesis protein [Prevotellaceae bacterium]|nr:phage virion morphogenesis protein [Prevotellaceae bacterium]
MTTKEFKSELAGLVLNFKRFAKQAKAIAATTAIELFKENFQDEGFFGRKWKQVQRRIPGTKSYRYPPKGWKKKQGAWHNSKILTLSTNLGRSLSKRYVDDGVIVFSNLPSNNDYSAAHNEGTTRAGKRHNIRIPRRQFLGKHKKLEEGVTAALQKELDKIIKK